MHEADHVVQVPVRRDGRSRVTGFGEQLQCSIGGEFGVEHEDLAAGDEHLVEGAIGDLERAVDDHSLLRG